MLYSQTRWDLQADSNEYMHRNAPKRDGPWPPSVLCRAVPSHTTRAGSWPHPRVQARCAARLIRGGTLRKKKSGPAGSSRAGVGRLAAAAWASVVLAGQVERRDEPLSLRSWAAGKKAEEESRGRTGRIPEDHGDQVLGFLRVYWCRKSESRCSASLAVLLRSAAAACSS